MEVWARQVFGEHAPSIQTLRRWARNGKILPAPRKIGRAFYCTPTAQCYDDVAERIDEIYGQ
ncbi:excisionase [Paraburkholderia tropica]|nr:excisionase [Paraburkholderia tropica]QNB10892.1 excisionase [Paraburkholderia tropica]